MLANPGVAPFLGENVLKSMGQLCNAICVEPPDVDSMAVILKAYNSSSAIDEETIEKIARSFHDLLGLNLAGKLQYSYGLREAISVVKD